MSKAEKPNAANSGVAGPAGEPVAWWRLLTRYHWFVLVVAALGWMFDCYDQQIFTNSRSITMRDLMPQADSLTQIKFGGWATAISRSSPKPGRCD